MLTHLFRKLNNFQAYSEEDKAILSSCAQGPIEFAKGHDIMREGSSPGKAHVLVDGWACRYKIIDSGKSQIVAFLIPGDLCDIHISLLNRMDHSIATITPVIAMAFTREKLNDLFNDHPRVAKSFTWSILVDEAILRQWLVCIGRLTATAALAHLLCELFLRHKSVGLAQGNEFCLPLTQTHLSEALGITHVHTNRALHTLRSDGLIEMRKPNIKILDWDGLAELANFSPDYLHLKGLEMASKA
ncbi:MAG TPA: Crp/Fnr family transcriptional regulator [Halomonas sp.]|nr:Crp/Fnr family transcriptional regulator [Halomonas sp.]